MDTLQRATQILADAEASLRRLIGEAADTGDYGSVEALLRWASTLGEMSSERRGNPDPRPAPAPEPSGRKVDQLPQAARSKPAKTSGKRRSYPLFAKSGSNLVKIAWSKSSKSEYQHKSPLLVTTKLAEALGRQGKGGDMISMDKVLPLKLDDGTEVPDYQAYVSLAWFRQIGAVKQNGRQGYTVKSPSDLPSFVQAAWNELPEAKPV